jgi:hypothetical protein
VLALVVQAVWSLTWVRLSGPMALIPMVHIRVKAQEDYGPKKKPKDY